MALPPISIYSAFVRILTSFDFPIPALSVF